MCIEFGFYGFFSNDSLAKWSWILVRKLWSESLGWIMRSCCNNGWYSIN